MRALLPLATLALAYPSVGSAHEIPLNTIQGLIQNCSLDDPSQLEVEHHAGLCLGFIKGVSNSLGASGTLKACLPASLQNDDLVEMMLSRARLIPKSMFGESSAMFVRFAIEDAFPCPQ